MAQEVLQSKDLGLGRVILLATDSVGMACEGAFWFLGKEGQWQYFLITSLLDAMGPREVYTLLDKALSRRLSEEEAEHFTIFITTPSDPLVELISEQIKTDRLSTAPRTASIEVDGTSSMIVVYRLASELLAPEVKKVEKRFRKLADLEVA